MEGTKNWAEEELLLWNMHVSLLPPICIMFHFSSSTIVPSKVSGQESDAAACVFLEYSSRILIWIYSQFKDP